MIKKIALSKLTIPILAFLVCFCIANLAFEVGEVVGEHNKEQELAIYYKNRDRYLANVTLDLFIFYQLSNYPDTYYFNSYYDAVNRYDNVTKYVIKEVERRGGITKIGTDEAIEIERYYENIWNN